MPAVIAASEARRRSCRGLAHRRIFVVRKVIARAARAGGWWAHMPRSTPTFGPTASPAMRAKRLRARRGAGRASGERGSVRARVSVHPFGTAPR